MAKVLLTTAAVPFYNYGFDEPILDANMNRLTKGQDIFTIKGHFHFPPLHTLAQNIDADCVVLEIPTMDTYREELKNDYDYVGITTNIVHMERIFEMCRETRKLAPRTKIILGGYGVQCLGEVFKDDDELHDIADIICHGEGITFMRKLLGEPLNSREIVEVTPTCSGSPKFMTGSPFESFVQSLQSARSGKSNGKQKGVMSYLTSGLGCPNMCEFCSTSHFYDGEYVEISDAETLYKGLVRNNGRSALTMIWDEDLPQKKDKMDKLGQLIQEGMKAGRHGSIRYGTFGSVKALSNYSPEELHLNGLGSVWIGVESMFTQLGKREGKDVKALFDMLRNHGIVTTGSWIGGWDFHDRVNIVEDREFFIDLKSTTSQVSQLLPVPETALWERLKEEGRLHSDVPWKDFHFYGGAYKFKNFTKDELLFFVEDFHDHMYQRNGPTFMRFTETFMNGYEFMRDHKNPILRERGKGYGKAANGMRVLLPVVEAFPPNAFIRKKARELYKRGDDLFGPVEAGMKTIAEALIQVAAKYIKSRQVVPEPPPDQMDLLPKRYDYASDKLDRINRGEDPYRVTYPTNGETVPATT